MAHLARVGEVCDHTGKASTILAATIGYPGSSIAFAQLLTGMERAGLIQREIRGKRTYRIIPGPAAPAPEAVTEPQPAPGAATRPAPGAAAPPHRAAAAPAAPAAETAPGDGQPTGTAPAAETAPGDGQPTGTGPAGGTAPGDSTPAATGPAPAGLDLPVGPGGLNYDELARRLLVQVVRRLAGPDADRGQAAPGDAAATQETALPESALQETVASLEQKLASVTSRQRRLAEENSRLREQLRAAEQSLAEAQDRATAGVLAARFDSAEVLLLERLLSPLREERGQHPGADAG
jgi:hypothetical protein